MSNAMTPMRVARGISQSLCIVVLLLPAARSQRRTQSIAFGILFWFTAPGQMFQLERGLRHPCQGWLQRQHRPRTGDVLLKMMWLHQARPCSARWTVHSCRS